ncbi:unnamed protein product [Eretmochelys imbricata]
MPCTGVEMSQTTGKSAEQESPVIAKVICREYIEVSDMISLLSVTGLLVISIQVIQKHSFLINTLACCHTISGNPVRKTLLFTIPLYSHCLSVASTYCILSYSNLFKARDRICVCVPCLEQRWANYGPRATSSPRDRPAWPLSSRLGRLAPGPSPAVPHPPQPQIAALPALWPAVPAGQCSSLAGSSMIVYSMGNSSASFSTPPCSHASTLTFRVSHHS